MNRSSGFVFLALLVGLPSALHAQFAWETPRMLGPDTQGGLAIHWLQAETLPGDDQGVMAIWQPPGLPESVFLRGGAGTGAGDETAGFGGVDVRTRIATSREGQPLDIAWIAGAGVGVGDYLLFTVPVGISAGRSWASGSVWFSPYVGIGVAMDYRRSLNDDDDFDDEFDVYPTADLGVDLALDPGRHFILRAGASLGDRQAIALGVQIR
ncbi:MAG: hypothetical protein ACF8Q5_13470 [Phycisphaerales bacterium JB040]